MTTLHPFKEQRVKALLAEAGVSQNQFAKHTGSPQSNVNKIVNGRRAPSLRIVEALEEITGRPVSELFDEELYAQCKWRLRELKTGSRRPGGDAA